MKRFLPILLGLILSLEAMAQWTTQTNVNTLVSSAPTEDMKAIGTPEGKTWVVFWRLVPAPEYYQMWAQLLDVNGDTLLGLEGIPVNTVVPMSSYTTLWDINTDEYGSLYVALNGTGSGNPVYVHKISTSGAQLWGPAGVLVGTGLDPKILPLSTGEAIVSWLPGNQALFNKIDSSGALAWTTPKTVPPGVAGHSCTAGELAALSGGDFLIFIHDRSGFGISSLFYAQRYNSDGIAQWVAPKALASSYTSFNSRYDVVMDNDTAYLGYSASVGLVFHSYLQRLNPDGTTPWGINGSDFATQSALYEMNTSIAYDPGSPFVWAICRFTPPSQGQSGEYVQKFDKSTGARLLGANAKEVFPISSNDNAHAGRLQLMNDLPLFLITDGTNNGALPIDLLVTYLDSSGDFVWPQQTLDMGTYVDFKSRIQFCRPYQGQAVAVWVENRSSGSLAYAQNIIPCVAPQAGFTFTNTFLQVSFTSLATGADSLWWDFGDGSSSTQTNPMHTYAAAAVYTVCLYAINACGADTACLTIDLTATGTMEPGRNSALYVFPTPARGAVSVQLPALSKAPGQLEVYSLSGQKVRELSTSPGSECNMIRIESLPPGTYILRYMSAREVISRRFTIIP